MSVCKECDETLVLRLDLDEDSKSEPEHVNSVPDDLELPCGCHFHWQCLLDQSSEVALSLKCPSCNSYLSTSQPGPSATNPFLPSPGSAILTRYINEGGIQENLDVLPVITEEAYLESHPEARPARALHLMCMEGDVGGIVELLRDVSDEVQDLAAFIGYQDPLSEMKSGLHLAVEHSQEEVLWLLLWLCSTVPDGVFPETARQRAQATEVGRLSVTSDQDVRVLRDSQGQTAGQQAEQNPERWTQILEANILSV